ncbi:MAG: lipase family protein [Cyanobacteria bacterium J06626_23]
MDYQIAYRCALLSNAVYQELTDRAAFPALPGATKTFFSNPETDTQLAILTTQEAGQSVGYIVFRGSAGEADWRINLSVRQEVFDPSKRPDMDREAMVKMVEDRVEAEYRQQVKAVAQSVVETRDLMYPNEYADPSRPVKMHSGFIKAYISVREQIHQQVQQSGITQWWITGHSLGGALAYLCGLDLQYNFDLGVQVYTFGAPKVGNEAFVESYNRRVPNTWRVVHGWDIVSKLPRWWQGDYQHVDTLFTFKRGFSWRVISGSIEDHRMTSYIRVLNEAVRKR